MFFGLVREYFTHIETPLLLLKGCKTYQLLVAYGPLAELERLTIVLADLGLNGFIHKAAPFSRLLQQARDTEELLF